MTEANSLIIFTHAVQLLAEADTIQKAKELKDLAIVAGDWAKRKDMGDEAIQYARSYALEAERKMGQLLAEQIPHEGGRPSRKPSSVSRVILSNIGLTWNESSQAQILASLPQETFEAVKSGEKTLTQVRREQQRDNVTRKIMELPTDEYRILYADPPWAYNDKCDDGSVQAGGCERHYPTMNLAELCALPIESLADDNAVLFLWATSPMLPEALQVVLSWGFKYKASFIWDKVKHNMGHYNSVRHEFLLICTKGSCLPDSRELIDSVQTIERAGHSEKPEEFRRIIDTLYPIGKRIELFSRSQHENWESWGNEID